jgi:hypothetical protein
MNLCHYQNSLSDAAVPRCSTAELQPSTSAIDSIWNRITSSLIIFPFTHDLYLTVGLKFKINYNSLQCINAYVGALLGRSVKLTTHLPLVSMSRMRRALPPFCNMVFMHRNNLTQFLLHIVFLSLDHCILCVCFAITMGYLPEFETHFPLRNAT